jgi:hypothetical protein
VHQIALGARRRTTGRIVACGIAWLQRPPAPGTAVTQENYCRAENSRMLGAGVKRAGRVNRWDYLRSVTPLDRQTAVRMNAQMRL